MKREAFRSIWKLLLMLTALGGCSKQAVNYALARRFQEGVHPGEGYAYPLPYRLFIPADYDSGRDYPLILYLHGSSERGDNNLSQLDVNTAALVSGEVQEVAQAFVLVPHCPEGDQWVNGAKSIPCLNYRREDVPESDASKMVFELLGSLPNRYSIDSNRLYVTGPSMGGSGTWDFISRHPGVFAAAVPVTGVNDPNQAPIIARMPVWSYHGADDGVSPVENSRAMIAALRDLGSPVKYTELPGVHHDCWKIAYQDMDMYRWLFAQTLEPATSKE